MKNNLADTMRDARRVKLMLMRAGKPMRTIEIMESLGWEDTPATRSRFYTVLAAVGSGLERFRHGKYIYKPTAEDREFANAVIHQGDGNRD